MVNFDNSLQFFDPQRYESHIQKKFPSPEAAKNHFLRHIQGGKFVFNIERRVEIYELAVNLINNRQRLDAFVDYIDNGDSGQFKENPKDLEYITSAFKNQNQKECLLNIVEFALSNFDPSIQPNSRYAYSASNMPYWWWNKAVESNITMSVALPILKNKDIIWLPLESLKRQKQVHFNWELISFEENGLSRGIIKSYINKLPGCYRIVHRNIRPNEGLFPPSYTLLEKWVNMAKIATRTSKIFVAQASDCFSPKWRLRGHYINFKQGCDFSKRKRGYFYDINSNKYAFFDVSKHKSPDHRKRQGLDYACKINLIKSVELPKWPCLRFIDNFFSKNMNLNSIKIGYYDNIFPRAVLDGLDTDGKNNISLSRRKVYVNLIRHSHLYAVSKPSLTIPPSIFNRLSNLKRGIGRTKRRKKDSSATLPPVSSRKRISFKPYNHKFKHKFK